MKKIVLTLALILPIGIFLFLKIFGKNEFAVAPLYQAGTIAAPDGCVGTGYEAPYHVPDDALAAVGVPLDKPFTVIPFQLDQRDRMLDKQIKRVTYEFSSDPIEIVWVTDTSAMYRQLRSCAFLLTADSSVVVVDHERNIRGHYVGSSREDMDRLILELKIMLKKY